MKRFVKQKKKEGKHAHSVKIEITHYNETCEGFGIAYFGEDSECRKCDESDLCKEQTDYTIRSKSPMNAKKIKKLLKEARGIEERKELLEFIDENEIEVKVGKKDSVAKILSKIEDALDPDDPDAEAEAAAEAEASETPEKETDPDDETEYDLAELEGRIKALESRVAELQAKLEAGGGTKGKGSKKEEKEAIKKELMKGVPYSKDKLGELNARELKMLGSAMGVKTFGKAGDEVKKLILAKQKKKASK